MALITTEDAKLFLGIEESESDTAIAQLIPKAEALFNSLIKVDSFNIWSKNEIAIFNQKTNSVRLKNFPVNNILSIDGVSYAWQERQDYIISKNEVKFINPDFLDKIKCGRIKLSYTYWYETIPEDLKLAILILVSWLYNIKENYGTTSCKIWQESINFRDVTDSIDFDRIYKTYKKKFISII